MTTEPPEEHDPTVEHVWGYYATGCARCDYLNDLPEETD